MGWSVIKSTAVPGGTYNYLSASDRNAVDNASFPRAIKAYNGAEILGGIDYTYERTRFDGTPFRKLWKILDGAEYDEINDVFKIGDLAAQTGKRIEIYYFFGYRVRMEFFRENAIADFVDAIDEGVVLQDATDKFIELYSRRYDVRRLNDFLINLQPYA